jgi:hypothetical protein
VAWIFSFYPNPAHLSRLVRCLDWAMPKHSDNERSSETNPFFPSPVSLSAAPSSLRRPRLRRPDTQRRAAEPSSAGPWFRTGAVFGCPHSFTPPPARPLCSSAACSQPAPRGATRRQESAALNASQLLPQLHRRLTGAGPRVVFAGTYHFIVCTHRSCRLCSLHIALLCDRPSTVLYFYSSPCCLYNRELSDSLQTGS